jgi:hypothetical protein
MTISLKAPLPPRRLGAVIQKDDFLMVAEVKSSNHGDQSFPGAPEGGMIDHHDMMIVLF